MKGTKVMKKIKRDTTKDLFFAALNLVKENGHYDKAEAIMDYYLPNESENNIREDIELPNYEFDFEASVHFGGSEGIYINCFLYGKYTETELKRYNHSTRQMETETRRHIGTFKTLKTDINSMKIMGELCGALVFYASQYINENIDRYTPEKEFERQRRIKNCTSAQTRYTRRLAEDMALDNVTGACETCEGKLCRGKQDGCRKGIYRFLIREIGKYSSMNYNKEAGQYSGFLDGKYNITDCFDEYVNMLTSNFPDLTIYQAAGYVFSWLCTRKQNFIYYFVPDEKNNTASGGNKRSYESLNSYEQKQAFKLVKEQLIKESIENDGDIDNITDESIFYYVRNCVYFYENCILTFEY
jgi:hypothetical protein